MSERLIVIMSERNKSALEAFALRHKTSMMDVARQAIAERIKYALDSDPTPVKKNQKYASAAEREAAQKAKAAADRALVKQLKREHAERQAQAAREALARSLAKK